MTDDQQLNFSPHINAVSREIDSWHSPNTPRHEYILSRNNKLNEYKSEKLNYIKKQLEDEEMQECTFVPKTNNKSLNISYVDISQNNNQFDMYWWSQMWKESRDLKIKDS